MSSRSIQRFSLTTFVLVAILMLVTSAGLSTQAGRQAVDGLPAFFRTGGALQDRNGDGVVDFVDARLVIGEAPSDDEVAAAGDVAARLGFETSAMNLPIATGAAGRGVAIVVGPAGLARAGLAPSDVGAASLSPGEGVVAVATGGSSSGLVVTGGDGAGVRAAADALAGRLPYVWEPKGDTVDKVANDVRAFLAGEQVTVQAVGVPAVFVKSGGDALERLVVDVTVGGAGDLKKAQAALAGLRPAPSRRKTAQPAPAPAPAKLSYAGTMAVQVRLSAAGAPAATVDLPRVTPPVERDGPLPRRPGSAAKADLDLSSLYENEGLLGDSDNNLIPDRVDAVVTSSGPGTDGVISLAARLGLESTGISVPLVLPPGEVGKPASEPTLVIVGASHPLIDQLVKDKKLERPALGPGEGLVQVVKKAFGEKGAVVVTGGDARGVARAVAQVAERFPHIWARGKDRTTLGDVEEDVHDLIGGRSPAGQAAIALYKLDRIASRDLAGKDLASAHVKVAVEKAPDGLAAVVQQEAAARIKAGTIDVAVENLDVQKAKTVIDDAFDVPSEVDDFWQALRTKVLPAVKKNKRKPVVLEARLSESPEVRERIQREARDELVKAGAAEAGTRVTVLCAYKQGFSWLNDVVKPQLAGKAVDAITIRFAEIGPPPEWKQQAMYAPTRWLMEIYPIDEVLARDLKIGLAKIRFEEAPIGSPAYEVTATSGGAPVFHGTFEPKFVVRQFYDQFPDYEKVRVTTGWVSATVGARPAVDERIVTDVERFWDHFQSKTLTAIYAYMMTLGDGKPRAEDAPFFGELRVDLSLSEPDYRIGIDEEQISSLESMHEEIYFNTLQYFDLLGRFTRGAPLAYPGRIIPIMRPKNDGRPGHAHITFTGFDSPRPEVVVTYKTRDGREGEARRDVPKAAVDRPEALAALVGDGQNGLARLDLRVKVDTEKDERPTLITETREEQVDRQIMSAAEVKAVVDNLARLRAAGLYRDALAYHDLGAIRIAANWTFVGGASTEVVAELPPNGSPAPFPDIRALLPAGYQYDGKPIVQWDEPISPAEAYGILAKMSTFKEATVYKVGHSYLGQDIWAMDLMPPIEASHWSQAKATTFKPTVIYSARQHANEVSATSHTLKLAEKLLTDPAYRKKLDRVNAVFHPITNPDGAQLAYDLQKITPHFMLHAGYLGSLGVDMTSAQWDADAIYPESRVRADLWRTWLPDIFLNPHGYPSHEWVQLFSEYAAWIRNRIGESRDYWAMRGWWTPGFGYLDDPRYPRHKEAQLALRAFIAQRINAAAPVKALNDRAYARYTRYTIDWDKKLFKLGFTDGVLMYSAIKGAKASPTNPNFMVRQPNVTIFDGSTEAPDETAHGDWMKLVATAGLTWDEASLDYLVESEYKVERDGSEFYGGVSLSVNRPRPPKKPEAEKKAEGGGD